MNTRSPSSTFGILLCVSLAAGCGGSGDGDGSGPGTDAGSGSTVTNSTVTNSTVTNSTATDSSDASGSGGTAADSTAGEATDAGGSSEGTDSTSGGEAGLPVDLGTAGDFAILAKSGISTVPTSAITGDLGVSPAAATYITGFSLTVDASNEFATSAQVTGNVYASDYAAPTPTKMTTAVSDMETAFTDAAGRAPDVTELGAGDISGMTLDAGVYKWGTGLLIASDVTLDGDATDVWIFQIAQDLTVGNATQVVLSGGALPKNVFWQVEGQVMVGTTAHVEGVVLTQTAITLGTGASVDGRLLAQTAVDIDASAVVQPAP
jgi:hypothetical protein